MGRLGEEELIDEAWGALEEGDYESACDLAERVLVRRPDDPDANHVAGAAKLEVGEPLGAIPHLERADASRPDDPEILADLGGARFEALLFRDARTALAKCLSVDKRIARAHHWLGLLEEREGNDRAARTHFEKATKLAPEAYPAPYRVTETEFRTMVEEAIAELPEDFRASLSNLDIVVEPLPDDRTLSGDPPLSPAILGLHVGYSADERPPSGAAGQLPNLIFLFQRNIERASESHEDLVEEIRITLLHEIGHYLGLDEDEVEERGLE